MLQNIASQTQLPGNTTQTLTYIERADTRVNIIYMINKDFFFFLGSRPTRKEKIASGFSMENIVAVEQINKTNYRLGNWEALNTKYILIKSYTYNEQVVELRRVPWEGEERRNSSEKTPSEKIEETQVNTQLKGQDLSLSFSFYGRLMQLGGVLLILNFFFFW